MSTRLNDRKESKILFIDNMYQLVAHTWQYIAKLPKTTRFIFQQKIANIATDGLTCIVRANSIHIKSKEEGLRRKELFEDAIGYINSLEMLLSIVQLKYKEYISDFGGEKGGEYISKEVKLLQGILKSDELTFKKL